MNRKALIINIFLYHKVENSVILYQFICTLNYFTVLNF